MEIASIRESRKVKSMQMFKKPVQSASQGDRLGICVTQFDAKLLERGLVCSPGSIPWIYGGVIDLNRIPYFKGTLSEKSKYHISFGHETVLAKLVLFKSVGGNVAEFSLEDEFLHVEDLSAEDEDDAPKRLFAIVEFEKAVPVVPFCKGKFSIKCNCL